ncbi:MAG: hypothetical protein B6I20_00515 [Bacteroidetes bacterium 4572_117]|nr:MAG: hypothetical protein B6I20_00515 [Bacteroidetes bacterium 4572_117]
MKYLNLSAFIILLSLTTCNAQNNEHQNNNDGQGEGDTHVIENKKPIKNRPFNPKNLKLLSEFIDTLLLDRHDVEIGIFLKDDSLNTSREIEIVFSGSSSIRRWNTLETDMDKISVLNRGFGGSTIPDAIYFADILFFKHNPSKIVFYSGDNDVAWLKSSTEKISKSYKLLFKLLRSELPETKIFILSVKPSPGRRQFWPQMQEVNQFLATFCQENNKCEFIDVSSCLLDSSGNFNKKLFNNDNIHLNEKGYHLWADIVFQAVNKN